MRSIDLINTEDEQTHKNRNSIRFLISTLQLCDLHNGPNHGFRRHLDGYTDNVFKN